MASTIITPGITGKSGKWPLKKGSFAVTFLMPTTRSALISRMRSTSSIGKRCGSMSRISSESISAMGKTVIIQPMHALLRYAVHKQEETIEALKAMVECESPSDAPNEVNRLVELLVEQTREFAKAKVIRNRTRGNHLLIEFVLPQARKPRKRPAPILALGHSDT